MKDPAQLLVAYCNAKNYPITTTPGHLNILYVEGVNPDFTPNDDAFDGWNDLRILLDHKLDTGLPFIAFSQVATTEPGSTHTFSMASKKNGGVARLAFRHYARKWVMGYHNYSRERNNHPALVQKQGETIMVHRDIDRNGKRTGDPISPAFGVNHHGVHAKSAPKKVGLYSAGCPVGLDWALHIEFIIRCSSDLRYQANKAFAFSATIIAGDDLLKFEKT